MRSTILLACSTALLAGSCGSSGPKLPAGWEDGAPKAAGHLGPAVDADATGTARFVPVLMKGYDTGGAMVRVRELDGWHRAPASDGYEEAIDALLADLYGVGFGADEGFGLDIIEQPMAKPAWTPISASIEVVGKAEGNERSKRIAEREGRKLEPRRIKIAGFDDQSDDERVMIPIDGTGFTVAGNAVFSLDDVVEGSIFVTDQSVRRVEQDAAERGAAAIVSYFRLPYCDDPTGEARHFDAIYSGSVRPGSTMPSMYVSPRVADVMRNATNAGSRLRLDAKVKTEIKNLRTIVATIDGTDLADECVYVVAHVDGAGANDNAAGAAGVVQLARCLRQAIDSGDLRRPRRTLRFVFGREARGGTAAMEHYEDDTVVCGIVADMIGTSYRRTGAVCLLERGWDPGAVVAVPPDEHTPWGAGDVVIEDIVPNGLSIVLREALVDVGREVQGTTGVAWSTREHPWEGGSDHDSFLEQGIAGALVWHFTDFSYSTSLDRIDHVDAEELRRTTVAIGAAAMAIADARPGDLERHLDTMKIERDRRRQALGMSGHERADEIAELWTQWFDGARFWLKAVTAGEPLPDDVTLVPNESDD